MCSKYIPVRTRTTSTTEGNDVNFLVQLQSTTSTNKRTGVLQLPILWAEPDLLVS
jgi:hypothetical protein